MAWGIQDGWDGGKNERLMLRELDRWKVRAELEVGCLVN